MPLEQRYRRTHDVDLQRIVRSIAAEAHLCQAGKEYVPHGLNRCLYLSYAPEDSEIVRAFAKELERCGVDVWFDEDRIGEKPDYDALIAKALIFSGGFAPFLTDAFFACNLAQFEYKLIVGMIKQLKNKYYAPIVPYDDLPPGLNRSGLITLFDAPLLGAARIVAAQMARFLTRILAPAASREANYLASEFLRVTGHPKGVPAPVRFIGLPEDMRVFLSAAHLDAFKKHGIVPTGITTYERKGTLSLSTEDHSKLAETHERCLEELKTDKPVVVMDRLFISYASEDVELARLFAHNLTQLGLRVWLDEESIIRHENWIDEVYGGLRSSNSFVSIVTPSYWQSTVATMEHRFFRELLVERFGLFCAAVFPYKGDFDKFRDEHKEGTYPVKLFETSSLDAAAELVDRREKFYAAYAEAVRLAGLPVKPDQ